MPFKLALYLSYKSILNRGFSTVLTVVGISISVVLLLAVETIRHDTKASFTRTVAGTDLIVGARSGSVQLLLYSIFRIGSATNNISWESYQELAQSQRVDWAVPISLGDSHRGYRVMGTTQEYFEKVQFGNNRSIAFSHGRQFEDLFDAVIGADVARKLGYGVSDSMILAHGIRDTHFARHDDKPFRIVGILKSTGTPIDQTIMVSLEGIEALHVDWKGGIRSRNTVSAEEVRGMSLVPTQVTAVMLGLHSKLDTFKLQRAINQYRKEPLLAILPGVALGELWQIVSIVERALWVLTVFVLLNSFVALVATILSTLNERRREIAMFRALGCRPRSIFTLLSIESGILSGLGCLVGIALFYVGLLSSQTILQDKFGLYLSMDSVVLYAAALSVTIVVLSVVLGLIPGYRAYRNALADGLSLKI